MIPEPPLWYPIFAVLLLPALWVVLQTVTDCFLRTATRPELFMREEGWFFVLGAVVWAIVFTCSLAIRGEPPFLHLYVLGHEWTHAIWVWMHGGTVETINVHEDGGYVITDTHNFLVALSPYFYPVFSILTVAIYGIAACFVDLSFWTPLFFDLLGITWSFHITFTIWMILRGQSDLEHYGVFFSVVVIVLVNLIIFAGLLVVLSPHLNPFELYTAFVQHGLACWETVRLAF